MTNISAVSTCITPLVAHDTGVPLPHTVRNEAVEYEQTRVEDVIGKTLEAASCQIFSFYWPLACPKKNCCPFVRPNYKRITSLHLQVCNKLDVLPEERPISISLTRLLLLHLSHLTPPPLSHQHKVGLKRSPWQHIIAEER